MNPISFDRFGSSSTLVIALAVLTGLMGFVITVCWVVISWRAMKAHERLPETLALALRQPAEKGAPPSEFPGGT